jgi:hypothetical protein
MRVLFVYRYSDPLVLHPGDVIRTNCHFASRNKLTTTFFGEATQDEMCFGFLDFYPKENIQSLARCVQYRGKSIFITQILLISFPFPWKVYLN